MEERLTLGPAWVQLVKPALTRARTAAWRLRGRPRTPGLRILFYHRVADARDPLAIAPRRFAEHMDELRSQGYRVLDVVAAMDTLSRSEPDDRIVGLSFDDGYREPGANSSATDPLALNRIPVDGQDGMSDFRAKLAGGHDRPSLMRAAYRRARRALR